LNSCHFSHLTGNAATGRFPGIGATSQNHILPIVQQFHTWFFQSWRFLFFPTIKPAHD